MSEQPSRRVYAITLFLILLVCYGYFMPKWADWGANSRADLVYAFGDKGILSIDDYHENTGDKAFFEGHYYTDKSIGPSLVALPFYMVFKAVAALPPIQNFIESGKGLGAFNDTLNPEGEGIRPEAVYQGLALTFMTFFAMAVPSALLGVVVFLFAARFASKDVYAFILALAFGLGTMAFPYSNVLYQHQMAAFGAFVGFFLLWRIIYEKASLNGLWVVGLLFGLATITEYPVVPFLGIIFVWAAIKMPNRLALYRVVLGAIPLGLIFAAYNYAIFQTPLPAGYEYSTNWQGEHQTGFMSLTMPTLDRLYGLTFSPVRGIFLMSPFLLLAFPGFFWMWRERKGQRGTAVVIALVVLGFLAYNAASIMWWGGFTVGPRYLVPMLPFMMLPIIFALNHLLPRLWGKILVSLLFLVSFFSVWIMTISGQAWPPVDEWPTTFALMNAHSPLLHYSLPLFLEGDIARNYGIVLGLRGFLSLIPLVVAVAAIYFLLPRLLERRPQQQIPPQPRPMDRGYGLNLINAVSEKRNVKWIALALFVLTILTRLPFASQYLYHWDSVNMAFGILNFNVLDGAPQFPGYIVYIVIAQLFNAFLDDPQHTMVFISLVASGLSVVALYYLGRDLFNPVTGLIAALFLFSSPLFWFYGEIALPHTLDLFTIVFAAWLLYRIMVGQTRWLWWTVVFLALVGGFRQQTLLFLAPLVLFTCWRLGWARIGLSLILGVVVTLAWFIPLMVYSNGIQTYLAGSAAYSATFFTTTNVLSGAGMFGLRRNLVKLASYTLYGGVLALLPLLLWLPWLRRPRAWLANRKFWFLVLWITPPLAFYTIIHMGQQGLVFVFLPVLLLASAEALYRLLCARPALMWGATAAATVVGAAIFIIAPTYPLGESGPKLLTYSTIRESDQLLHGQITAVRDNFQPENTLLLAANWRHFQYYLPEYRFARFDVGAKYEVDEGQASGADFINQPQTAEQLGIESDADWQVVVMDESLLSFTEEPLKTVQTADGFQLPYLSVKVGQAYWTDGQAFGVKAEGTSSG